MKAYKQGLPDDGWDERQHPRGGHMLQGRPWSQFQQSLGRTLYWDEGEGWSWVGAVIKGRGVRYLYVPYGPTVRTAKTLAQALASVRRAGQELKVDFVRLEPVGVPEAAVVKTGLERVRSVQPQHTLMIDLTKSEEELRSALTPSHRNTINGAERRGITMRHSRDLKDLEAFLELTHATARDRGIRPHDDSYYRTMMATLMPLNAAELFIAEHGGTVRRV